MAKASSSANMAYLTARASSSSQGIDWSKFKPLNLREYMKRTEVKPYSTEAPRNRYHPLELLARATSQSTTQPRTNVRTPNVFSYTDATQKPYSSLSLPYADKKQAYDLAA